MQEASDSPSSVYGAALRDSTAPSDEPYKPIQVSLIDDRNLWLQFSKLGTEMVITKLGRQMFPGVKLLLENLKPYAFYKVYMEIAPVDNMRYKYEMNGWVPRGPETSVSSAWIEHPQSPTEGFNWMLKPIDFNARLSNCSETKKEETVCLHSMYKYMIIIHIEEGSDTTQRNLLLRRSFPLVKTTFIAVTAYRNSQVKELKTDMNIHAKGIRAKKVMHIQNFYESLKENFSESAKRSRMEHVTSSLDLRRESSTSRSSEEPISAKTPSTAAAMPLPPWIELYRKPIELTRESSTASSSEEPISAETPSTAAALPSWNEVYRKPIDLSKNDTFTFPDLSKYQRLNTPLISERIPFSTPLTVHCPSPCLPQYENLPYYNHFFPLHPQNFPFHPPAPSHSFFSGNWPTYSTKVLPSNCSCGSSNCRSSVFNVCSSCRDSFQNCVRCMPSVYREANNNVAPSSTTQPEISSFQRPRLPSPSSTMSESAISHHYAPEFIDLSPPSDENSLSISCAMDGISSSIAEVSSSSPPSIHSPLLFRSVQSTAPSPPSDENSLSISCAIDEFSSSIAEAIKSSSPPPSIHSPLLFR